MTPDEDYPERCTRPESEAVKSSSTWHGCDVAAIPAT